MSVGYASGAIHTFLYVNESENEILQPDTPRDIQTSLVIRLVSLSATETITTVLAAMAEKALEKWPFWYDSDLSADQTAPSPGDHLRIFLTVLELCRSNRNIEPSWLKKAASRAAAGKPPLVPGLVGEVQVRQLALTLLGCVARISLIVPPKIRNLSGANGFPRAVEWLARESGFAVTIFLPQKMADNEDFAPLLYCAEAWPGDRHGGQSGKPDNNDIAAPTTKAASVPPAPRIPDEEAPEAERLIGVPHPRSKGEQLLAVRLARDAQLSGLFGHNLPVNTDCGRRFVVDLLWSTGKTVVEVDGYYYHNNSIAFASDRDRDYRLLVSGYRVLRLTHDEVVRDVGLAVEKIRDVVNLVQKSGNGANNVR